MSAPVQVAELSEVLSFVSAALGWTTTQSLADRVGQSVQLTLVRGAAGTPPAVQEHAAKMLASIYRRAVTEQLEQVCSGDRLVALMRQARLDWSQLASLSGVTVPTLRKWAGLVTRPGEANARAVYNALHGRPREAPIRWPELFST